MDKQRAVESIMSTNLKSIIYILLLLLQPLSSPYNFCTEAMSSVWRVVRGFWTLNIGCITEFELLECGIPMECPISWIATDSKSIPCN